LATLQQLPEVSRILLWDADAALLTQVAAAQGAKVAATFDDLDALLAAPGLLACVAALRNDQGPGCFVRVLEAGKPLLAEKPIGRRADDAAKVIAAARRAGTLLSVCYQNRYMPWVQDARAFVRQGLLGELVSVEMRMITTQVRVRDPQHWLFRQEAAGGGVLSWLGCHWIDLMRYLTGDEIVRVAAEVATRSGEAIDVEDVAALAVRFASGAVGTLHAGYILALSGGGYHNPAGYDMYIGLNGRLGRVYWSTSGTPSSIYAETTHPAWAGAPQRSFGYSAADSPAYGGPAGEQFMRDFLAAAQGQGEPPTRGEDAWAVAQVVDAAYASSRSGRHVSIATQIEG
jgi:predicted dehydrogenase